MKVEKDVVQTDVPTPTSVGTQTASAGTVGSLCFNESKARDLEKLTDLVLTSTAFPGRPSRESVQGLVRTCLQMRAADLAEVYSFNVLGLSTGVAADLETGWNLETNSRRDKCSNELRCARPKVLPASQPIQLESEERKVITTRSHLIFLVRVSFEQMHRGDCFIFEHPSNASSCNEQCLQKLIAQPSVFRLEGPLCRWHLLSGKSGFVREPTSSSRLRRGARAIVRKCCWR